MISGVKKKLTKFWYYLSMKKYSDNMDLYEIMMVVISMLRLYDKPIDIILLKMQTKIPLETLIETLEFMCEFSLLTTKEYDELNIQLVENYKQLLSAK